MSRSPDAGSKMMSSPRWEPGRERWEWGGGLRGDADGGGEGGEAGEGGEGVGVEMRPWRRRRAVLGGRGGGGGGGGWGYG